MNANSAFNIVRVEDQAEFDKSPKKGGWISTKYKKDLIQNLDILWKGGGEESGFLGFSHM